MPVGEAGPRNARFSRLRFAVDEHLDPSDRPPRRSRLVGDFTHGEPTPLLGSAKGSDQRALCVELLLYGDGPERLQIFIKLHVPDNSGKAGEHFTRAEAEEIKR